MDTGVTIRWAGWDVDSLSFKERLRRRTDDSSARALRHLKWSNCAALSTPQHTSLDWPGAVRRTSPQNRKPSGDRNPIRHNHCRKLQSRYAHRQIEPTQRNKDITVIHDTYNFAQGLVLGGDTGIRITKLYLFALSHVLCKSLVFVEKRI